MNTRRTTTLQNIQIVKDNQWKEYKKYVSVLRDQEVDDLTNEARTANIAGDIIDQCTKLHSEKYKQGRSGRGRPKGTSLAAKRKSLKMLRDVVNRHKLEKVIDVFQWMGCKPYRLLNTKRAAEWSREVTPSQFAQKQIDLLNKPRAVLEQFVEFLESNDLYLSNRSIKHMFIRNCELLEDAEDLDKSFKNMFKRIKSLRNDLRARKIKKIQSSFENYKQIFKTRDNVDRSADYTSFMFDKLVTRKIQDNMVIYRNSIYDPKEGKVVCAYVDGKHSKCPKGWQQSFDLILEVELSKMRKSITYATALLKDTKQSTYEELFEFLKNGHCPKLRYVISDFEVAIFNAVQKTWPKTNKRGCFYHYLNNLLKKRQILDRGKTNKISLGCYNLATILPFLKYPSYYIFSYLSKFDMDEKNFMRCRDFRFLIYVYQTYVVKLRSLFLQDLTGLRIRTNNVAEGKNCSMSLSFNKKPSLEEYVDQIVYKFINEKISPWHEIPKESYYDKLLKLIQHCSDKDPQRILNFCSTATGGIKLENAFALFISFDDKKIEVVDIVTPSMDNDASIKLRRLSKKCNHYRKNSKKDFSIINRLYEDDAKWGRLLEFAKHICNEENINDNKQEEESIISDSFLTNDMMADIDQDIDSNYDENGSVNTCKALRVPSNHPKRFAKSKKYGLKNNTRSRKSANSTTVAEKRSKTLSFKIN